LTDDGPALTTENSSEADQYGKVTWTPVADRFLPVARREEFLAEAAQSQWLPANGTHAMSPGLALKEVIPALRRDVGLRTADQVAYSQMWIMREGTYELPDPLEDPDFTINATILGLRSTVDQLTFYLLDLGTDVAPIALIDDRASNGPGGTTKEAAIKVNYNDDAQSLLAALGQRGVRAQIDSTDDGCHALRIVNASGAMLHVTNRQSTQPPDSLDRWKAHAELFTRGEGRHTVLVFQPDPAHNADQALDALAASLATLIAHLRQGDASWGAVKAEAEPGGHTGDSDQ
jgi:hypothetical protein